MFTDLPVLVITENEGLEVESGRSLLVIFSNLITRQKIARILNCHLNVLLKKKTVNENVALRSTHKKSNSIIFFKIFFAKFILALYIFPDLSKRYYLSSLEIDCNEVILNCKWM